MTIDALTASLLIVWPEQIYDATTWTVHQCYYSVTMIIVADLFISFVYSNHSYLVKYDSYLLLYIAITYYSLTSDINNSQ